MSKTPTQPRKAPSQKRAQATVKKVLDGTIEILREQGADAINTRNIAKQTGVSPGSIYQYFGNKEQILYTIYGERLSITIDAMEAVCTAENFALSFEEFWQVFRDSLQDVAWGSKEDIELNKAIAENPSLKEAVSPILDRLFNCLITILESYGSKWPKPDLKHLAEYIYNIDHLGYSMRINQAAPQQDKTQQLTRDVQYHLMQKALTSLPNQG